MNYKLILFLTKLGFINIPSINNLVTYKYRLVNKTIFVNWCINNFSINIY